MISPAKIAILNIFVTFLFRRKMIYKIGDKVSFLNEKGKGVITNILTNYRVLVMNDDGFEISYPANEIVLLSNKSEYKMDSTMNPKWMDGKEEQKVKPPKLSFEEAWEVDLHLHELVDLNENKSDYEKLNLQVKYFRKCMDAAIAYRIKKIIFIHGVGKGTLKQEIIHELKKYARVKYYDAPYKKYGFGALTVEL